MTQLESLRPRHHTTRKIQPGTRHLRSPPFPISINSPLTTSLPIDSGPIYRPAMSSLSIFRIASRAVRPASFVRAPIVRSRVQTPVTMAARARTFGTTSKLLSGHEDETYEEFSARYGPS